MKDYADKRNGAGLSPVTSADIMLERQRRKDKLSSVFNPSPLVVTEKKGTMVTARQSDGSHVTRNAGIEFKDFILGFCQST